MKGEISSADKLITLMREQQASNERIIAQVTQVVNTQAAATTAMAESFSNYLKLFQVQSPPERRVTPQEVEQREMLAAKGYPVDGSWEEQLRFLLKDE